MGHKNVTRKHTRAVANLNMRMNCSHTRYTDYAAPVHEQHLYYTYEPSAPSQGYAASSKHNYGGHHKNNPAMSALTLLAFLFFLHILQQCLKDHMNSISSPPLMIMTAKKEGEEEISRGSHRNNIDKTYTEVTGNISDKKYQTNTNNKGKIDAIRSKEYNNNDKDGSDNVLMKVNTAEYTPKSDAYVYGKSVFERT